MSNTPSTKIEQVSSKLFSDVRVCTLIETFNIYLKNTNGTQEGVRILSIGCMWVFRVPCTTLGRLVNCAFLANY